MKKYITPEDFTEPLYETVAKTLFEELETGQINPAAIISLFPEEEQQKEVAALFNTKLEQLEDLTEREKAFHDIVYAVKKNSYEYATARLGTDVSALNQVIAGKKALEELNRVHISLQ